MDISSIEETVGLQIWKQIEKVALLDILKKSRKLTIFPVKKPNRPGPTPSLNRIQ
jgi:hypothetical protein